MFYNCTLQWTVHLWESSKSLYIFFLTSSSSVYKLEYEEIGTWAPHRTVHLPWSLLLCLLENLSPKFTHRRFTIRAVSIWWSRFFTLLFQHLLCIKLQTTTMACTSAACRSVNSWCHDTLLIPVTQNKIEVKFSSIHAVQNTGVHKPSVRILSTRISLRIVQRL